MRYDDLRMTFDQAADRYDAARPDYPQALFDDLIELTGLSPGAVLLEVGCGTGKATKVLASRGYSIVCVELGKRLAEVARASLPASVQIEEAAFEEWLGPTGAFELVYAATAWHWLDPGTKFGKAHALLRPGGYLAFWGASHAFPEGFDPFFTEIQSVYDEIGESHEGEWPPPAPSEVEDESSAVGASGLFDLVDARRYVWEQEYDADAYVSLLDTFSGHLAMAQWKRDRLYSEVRRRIRARPHGRVTRHWISLLHVARRLPIDGE